MWKNTALKRISERIVRKIGSYCRLSPSQTQYSEKTPLLNSSESDISTAATVRNVNEDLQTHRKDSPDPAMYDEILSSTKTLNEKDVETENYGVFSFPSGEGCWTITEWVLGWPARIIFTLTIPDCRKARFRKFYPLTFIMCIVYIAFLSYVVSWLMTVIGFTFGIPDSVMGLTFIAAGASVPEVASSIIVAKQGKNSRNGFQFIINTLDI
ncbi:unnamed protein product [Allacma fusca]|uniref:Sodium/calcium exchanger membrane region domain-containing protein n=1 Tax=Allacma fusca TaxID=39272 RepID=A0A8J2K632_9HEXA|nr:unnamed protein product [Allacma fusca]